ncbi:PREDICTED: uncharacterized protein LOC104704028 [Camelina sativa]|uniref:Uncharacterized protein LOC104704028 n=1 Tax=Camelina sativa TaxID=90675 RepID=A0ABM1Q7Y0_CAMSA|nr:PREDICTED: uncharacterized protein LOC104704028 [Camelina sativa]
MMSKPAPKRPPSRVIDHDAEDEEAAIRSEDEEAFNMLRQLLPSKRFSRYEDDDINMEVGFEDIQKEERRRIAREEDEIMKENFNSRGRRKERKTKKESKAEFVNKNKLEESFAL